MRDRARPRSRHAGAQRVGVRPVQRAHRAARQPRRGRSARPAGHLPELRLRAAPVALRRGGLWLPAVGPDGHQRHQRQADPPAGRRRALRRPLRHTRQPRADPRHAGGHPQPPGPVDIAGPRHRAHLIGPDGVAHPAGHRGHRVRGPTGRRQAAAHRPAVGAGGERGAPPAEQGPARRDGAREPTGERGAHRPRPPGPARASHPAQRPAARSRDGSPRRGARAVQRRDHQLARRVPAHDRDGPAPRRAAARREVPRLWLVEPADPPGAARPGGRGGRGGAAGWLGRPAGRAARLPRRVLGRRRRRDRWRRRGAAGGALRALPHPPSRRPGRAAPDPGQGPHGSRLRRPHLLGHRDVRAAGAHVHAARPRRRRPALAAAHPPHRQGARR